MNPVIGGASILLGTAFLFTLVGVLKFRYAMSREGTRKSIHIGVGLIALSFPWTLGDTPVVIACFYVFTLLVVAGNLLADVAYAWIDPRISFD